MEWLKPVYFLVKCPFPWRLGSLFQLWLAGRYTGRQADIWDYCARLPASGNENYSPSDFHRAELLDVALHTRHETGSASQCLFNSASHMHLWAQWVPWPLALHTAESETGISNFTSTNGKAGVFLFVFFFKPGSKAFYNCSPAFNAATWRETSFKSFSVSYGFCLFVFLSRSVSETNHSDDRLFYWGLPKGGKKKALRYESGMTQVLPLLPGPRHQRKRCERWYCKRIAMNTFYPWVTAHAVRWWTYSILTECFR